MKTEPIRRRRPSATVRSLLLTSARDLFLENGYGGTTTKHISERAGVSERLLFNHFGTKDDLFREAIEGPFLQIVSDYLDVWSQPASSSTVEETVRAFVSGLFELARDNRALLRSTVGRMNGEADGVQARLVDDLAKSIQSMATASRLVSDKNDYGLDPPATVAASAAMVFGMALLDDMLFPQNARRPAKKRLVEEMTQMIIHGALHRHGDAS